MNIRKMPAAVALVALLPGSALAQTSAKAPGRSETATSAPNAISIAERSAAGTDTTYKVTQDGYLRASRLLGANVYTGADTPIGTVDDLLVGQHNQAAAAVVSVGGFLGIGSRLVEVPFSRLTINRQGHPVLAGATRDSLSKLPPYAYNR